MILDTIFNTSKARMDSSIIISEVWVLWFGLMVFEDKSLDQSADISISKQLHRVSNAAQEDGSGNLTWEH